MNTREIAAEYRLSHWAGIIRERNASSMSIKAFCQAAGFHENVYYYWQRKLREAACTELASQPARPGQNLVPNGWAVCEAVDAVVSEQPLAVEIGAYRVHVATDSNLELLAKVCRVLQALC